MVVRLAAGAVLAVSVTVTFGCGETHGTTFTAEAFIADANQHEANLVLGPPLLSDRGDVRELRFTSGERSAGGPTQGPQVYGSGSLTALTDSTAAVAEYERCQSAGALLCFRAANVALTFEDTIGPKDIARLNSALAAMAPGL